MERAAWTDARLDDFAGHVGSELRELRQDVRSLREEMRTEIGGVRGEIGGLRGEIDALRVTILRVGGGMMVGLLGVIAAVLARGV